MTQYQEIYDDYEWSDAWDAFEGERDGWFNLGYETIGKHADGDNRDAFAVRIVDFEDGGAQEFTYGDLDEMAGRFINYMHDLGLEEGDLVAAMLEPTPELYTTMLGCWLGRFQFVPLFSLFGPDAVNYRLDDAGVSAMVTSPQHRDKVDVDEAADLEHVIPLSAPSSSWCHLFRG